MSRLKTRGALNPEATRDIAAAMNAILADVFALYIKTKNFHWHMSGPHFHGYTSVLNEQAIQILAMSELIAERIRKLGGSTIRSIGQIARHQRVLDNDAEHVAPLAMLAEFVRTMKNFRHTSARPTTCALCIMTSRLPASSRFGSTKRSIACGFSSNRDAREAFLDAE